MTHRLCLIHPLDPRGAKVGGIETHVRLMLSRHPADVSLLFVGMDERGDLPLGKVAPLKIDGRTVDFLPVVHIDDDSIHSAARRLTQSVTLRFALGALRHLPTIRRLARAPAATTEIERFEFALLARAIGNPVVQVVHGEGSKNDRMDSLIKRFWWIHRLNEQIALRLAARVVAVNGNIVRRYEAEMPSVAAKSEVLSVSVDTRRFPPAPFETDGPFRIVFAGRLDAFKDPPLMFETLRRLSEALGGQVEFHYVGTSDPARDPEFAAIAPITVRHGFQDAAGVAAIMRRCHAGVLTSFFEGMPCYLLELLSSGRPVGAIRLPQYDPLVEAGVSGFLVERPEDRTTAAEAMAAGFLQLWDAIRAGRLDPDAIHAKVRPYSVDAQMPRLFDRHRGLARRPGGPVEARPAVS
ncbi:MAG TPA: glycosyltransferase [Methylomirabilota bacterium]|nr:glycosyltransferase [Methylomirabilota bacterium]